MPLGGALTVALAGLAGSGMSLFGSMNAQGQQNWNNDAKTNVLNALNGLLGNSVGQVSALSNATIPDLITYANTGLTNGNAFQNNTMNFLGNLMNQVNNGQFTKAADPNALLPGYNNIASTNASSWNTQNTASNQLQQMLSAVQSNPQLASVFKTATGLANGGGGQAGETANASNIFGNQGNTALNTQIQNAISPFLSNGGYTNPLNTVTNAGNSLLAPNPTVEQAQAQAGNILSQNPLLSMDQVRSMAGDQAATAANNQYQYMKQQLLNTTGVGGPAIASGGTNELLNQIGDQALQQQAAAQDQAVMNQQGLQESLFGQGINLFNSGTQGSLGYTGQGLNALLQAANQATGNVATGGNLGLSALNQVLQNLLGGSQLQSSANNTTLQALQSLLGGVGTQNQMTGTEANSLASLLGQGTGELNLASQNMFGAQSLNQSEQQNTVNALLNSIGQYGGMGNTMVGNALSAEQYPNQYLSEWMSNLANSYGDMTSLFGNVSTTPQNFMTAPASLLQGGSGALGNIFNQGVGAGPKGPVNTAPGIGDLPPEWGGTGSSAPPVG